MKKGWSKNGDSNLNTESPIAASGFEVKSPKGVRYKRIVVNDHNESPHLHKNRYIAFVHTTLWLVVDFTQSPKFICRITTW